MLSGIGAPLYFLSMMWCPSGSTLLPHIWQVLWSRLRPACWALTWAFSRLALMVSPLFLCVQCCGLACRFIFIFLLLFLLFPFLLWQGIVMAIAEHAGNILFLAGCDGAARIWCQVVFFVNNGCAKGFGFINGQSCNHANNGTVMRFASVFFLVGCSHIHSFSHCGFSGTPSYLYDTTPTGFEPPWH